MLILRDVSYAHINKELLFSNVDLVVNHHQKIALIGNNGAGKSTLLKIIAGELPPSGGQLKADTIPYYIPQVAQQYNHQSIAQVLKVEDKLNALKEILAGNVTDDSLAVLDGDWTIEDRCHEALDQWGLRGADLSQKMGTLSGGQKTKVFLSGIFLHKPDLILLDEPTNHLDKASRQQVYDFIQATKSALIVVSHDRKLLNLPDTMCELDKSGISVYSGNYDFYYEQKQGMHSALHEDIQNKEKALRKAREKERETRERQQKLDARGKSKQEKAGVARIMMNTLRNKAENSTSKLKNVHEEKIKDISGALQELRAALPAMDEMKIGFDNARLHKGKILFNAAEINFSYSRQKLWKEDVSFQITSGERIALAGKNGSGKTTLIQILLGDLEPITGRIYRAGTQSIYIDQDYSLINNNISVYEQLQQFNINGLQEHEMKIRLSRFLFTKEYWEKPCHTLSGGERMRLLLCCLTVYNLAPDIIILDEPTNNLDIQNVDILTAAVNEYEGTLIVVSHDETFLKQIGIKRIIQL